MFTMLGFKDTSFKKEVKVPDTTYLNALRWVKGQIDTVRLTDPSGREVMRQEVRMVSGVATRIPMEVQDGTYVLHFLSHRDGHAVAHAVVRHSTGPRP
jgi:methionine-rich copper-binding protein CopC